MKTTKKFAAFFAASSLAMVIGGCSSSDQKGSASTDKTINLLNVSYDPTRELYEEINKSFTKEWKEKTGQTVKIQQSHGGSGKQGRAVIDGLQADVVTLALAYDIDEIAANRNLINKDWQEELPDHSSPYTSTIVFLVRKGNPKHIQDWDDLVKKNVSVITPNPKTSGGARWNYLAAWGYADRQFHGDETKIKDFMQKLYNNVEVLDSGARGSTTTFTERQIGDVLIAWENEAYLSLKELGKDKFEIITPSLSILAEPPVAVVDKNAKAKGSEKVANAYLNFLYTDEGQEIAADNYYRPRNEKILKEHKKQFPNLKLITIDDFGGWQKAQKEHFSDGGTFDSIYTPNNQ
ncbi:sulfate ABC transporter substrate-binding protein [Rummeliibacillus sp. NPDC094406]|uniref:sulfate ABC transporter substrate-binding protein n=1 Tax=Rummeliibacillus sp. NPDC094406 TaxID=3364511 RepID=UPI0038140380